MVLLEDVKFAPDDTGSKIAIHSSPVDNFVFPDIFTTKLGSVLPCTPRNFASGDYDLSGSLISISKRSLCITAIPPSLKFLAAPGTLILS